jgi:hypothetical protein
LAIVVFRFSPQQPSNQEEGEEATEAEVALHVAEQQQQEKTSSIVTSIHLQTERVEFGQLNHQLSTDDKYKILSGSSQV